ncbi:MAG: Xaa-Pro peptidase family protein [Anaerolineales bacterium]|nr:Xaa-Pro peptidase family protein [Anaerolineales bacterium]MCS7248606.1 Xaa-Pro peptidase family protein [Anaerolineales bacterium]MDW8162419.1 Xaa-Pro peptidase family protein [Anaerolineales bacterium]MDW8446281.1 Xaa-Pro peptidase family protein [Anaerolineales bacterium]
MEEVLLRRLENLQAHMSDAGLDLVAITTAPNLRYFGGFVPHLDERFNALLISQKGVMWVAPELNREQIEAHVQWPLIAWRDDEGPQDAIRQALQQLGVPRTLGIDGAGRADILLRLQEIAQPQSSRSADGIIALLRQVKSADELEKLALAAAQADRAMQVAIEACRPGVTEREVAWAIEAFFRQDGAELVDFTLVASGPNGAFPHHHYSERVLQEGDAIILDIGATLNGYKSDLTRMVYLGEPAKEFLNAYAAVDRANLEARSRVKPQVSAQEIDRAARATLKEHGLAEFFVHRTGHGIGLDIHEPPYLMEGNEAPLQVGMTFSIEPGIYLVGRYGIRIEDIVAVTDQGVRVLSQTPHDLVIKSS